jgi:[protein-PII] uridylyltransferase
VLTLLEKIEADAAARLPIPSGRQPAQELTGYKAYLKVETHRLLILHRSGAGGREICQARAAMMDAMMRHLLLAAKAAVPCAEKNPLPPLALVAIGGYGRNELNPQSDIDIMFLHDGGDLAENGKYHACMSAFTQAMLYPLYDIGIKVGHSVRTIKECVKVANSDMQSKTSLLEARLVTGDAALFARMQKEVLEKCVEGCENEYIAARLQDQAARRAKYGDSATMQEPNIKNGCGGLRDYQNLLWMAYFKYRVRTLEELQKREWISESERHQLESAYDFLLRVRNDLHYHLKRPLDVILKGVQPTLANNLGYTDRSPIKRLEKFMRVLYTHMRNVYLITRTLEQRLAFQQKTKPRPSLRELLLPLRREKPEQLLDGFKIVNGELLPGSNRVFRDQPRRLMRVFLHAQQRGLKLHPDLTQMIRHQLNLVDRNFLHDPHVHETFLEILNQRGNVAPTLRTMHEVDLLGRYMPEFGKLTCLVQHEFFHRYTADEHTLICIEMLDAVWAAKSAPFNRYTALFQKIERPFVLYLALLLHDAGKSAMTRKHTDDSVRMALHGAKRLGLDLQATQSLKLIIENHLAMIQISQSRDLEDPSIARKFAAQIKTSDNLNCLLLHTLADSLGTRSDLWGDFKEALVLTLYEQTKRVLSGEGNVVRAEEEQRELLAQSVRKILPKTIGIDEFKAHFEMMPARYFQMYSVNEVLADIQCAHQFLQLQTHEDGGPLEPVLAWSNVADRGYGILKVCTWDRAGLFSKIAGALTAAELNIFGARIFSRSDGIIFDTFFVAEARTGALPGKEIREKCEALVKSALTANLDLGALINKQKAGRPIYQYLEGERIPTVIRFDNYSSDTHTIIDVETEDRAGLLYTLSRTLSELGLDIATAKISTEKGAALDSFYVRQMQDGKIVDADRTKAVEDELRAAVMSLDGDATKAQAGHSSGLGVKSS